MLCVGDEMHRRGVVHRMEIRYSIKRRRSKEHKCISERRTESTADMRRKRH
jgi:hypothetical protein